jgi:hypothetical protein
MRQSLLNRIRIVLEQFAVDVMEASFILLDQLERLYLKAVSIFDSIAAEPEIRTSLLAGLIVIGCLLLESFVF